MLPMMTILASTPWSYLAFRYGSIRGYSGMGAEVTVGEGGKEDRGYAEGGAGASSAWELARIAEGGEIEGAQASS